MKKKPTREKLLDITFDEVYIHGYTATSVDHGAFLFRFSKVLKAYSSK